MKILFIGSHYDDIELGAGGTLIKHINNLDDIYLAITSSDEFRTGRPVDRLKEENNVLDYLNVNRKILYLFSYKDEVHDIVGELDKIQPDIVFTHYEFDTHQDHRRASLIGSAVGRKRNITTVYYDSGSSYDFNPNVFSEIDFEKKQQILQLYETQIKCGAINLDILRKKNIYYGSLINKDSDIYAEAFVVKKMKWIV